MAVYIGHDECQVIYVAKNGQQLRVSSIWVGDQQVFPPANRQEIHVLHRGTQGFGRVDNGTHFAFAVPVPWWAASMDVVMIGAGEKGRDGTKSFTGGSDGAGGKSGAWVAKTVALTQSTDAVVRVGKGTSTSPHATEVILPGVGGQTDVRVYDGEGTRTPNRGSTGGTPSPQDRYEYGVYHYGAAGGSRNNAGGHPGGGGGGGQGSNLLGNPTTGQPGGVGYVWLRFRSAPALNPGGGGFILRVGVTSGYAHYPLHAWVASIGKTTETITEITVPMEVICPSLERLFSGCSALTSVPELDTSQVTNMYAMFNGCQALTTIPELNTSQVTDMSGVFENCSSLTSVPALNTSQVTNMFAMFYNCSSLTSVPALDTSQVTNMPAMFEGCSLLTTIPALNTSQVTNMFAMFNRCSSLTTIPALDTSQVTNMASMFESCSSLTSVPELNTSQVTNMATMFENCSSLTTIPALNTSQVTNMDSMFIRCSSLTSVPALDTSQVTNMAGMFEGCSSLTSTPALDTRKATSMYGTFYDCQALTSVPAMDSGQVTNVQYMFDYCSSLESVTLPGMGNGFTTGSSEIARTLDMRATKLNAAAANALMQSLGTPPPSGNLQLPATAAGADTSIATAKNWTVTIG